VAKWVRMSPRKARLVAEHIRGRTVPEARTVLAFTPRAAARELEKVLRSAVANAEANHNLVGDDLIVSAAFVDEGPVMKRWRARARGRGVRIHKPTCHITVTLIAPEMTRQPEKPPAAPAAEEEKPSAPRKPRATAKPKPKPKAESKSSAKPKASRRKS
jgi:large subunit ribosomal protein L22